MIRHNDEPIQSPSVYIQWSVMEAAKKEGIKVTLDGQGADELAAGYPAYFSVYLAQLLRELKIKLFIKNFKDITSKTGEGRTTVSLLLRVIYILLPSSFLKLLAHIPFLRFFMKGNSLTSLINKNYSKNWINSALDHQLLIKRESSSLKRRLRFDFFHLSLPALLRYEDRCSMAFSIEARTPFLDYRLVEEVQNSPSEYLIKDGLSKSFIRDAVYRFIPPLVFDRSDKKGYPTPSSDWIDASLDKIKSLFEGDCYVYKYIDEENFKNLLSSKDIKFKGNEIWRIIFLELWFKEFFDKDAERDVFLKNKRFI